MTGVKLREILDREHHIKVPATGNRYPIDPQVIRVWVPRTVSRPLISAFAASQPRSHGSEAAQQDRSPWPFDSRT
jgi:hypothetical protein